MTELIKPDPLPDLRNPPREDSTVPCQFICGSAGTGKTFSLLEKVKANPRHAIVASTTGVSAVNLNTTTINSLLGYFNTASLRDRRQSGKLQSRLRKITLAGVRNIAIDECSMMAAEQLDIIHNTVDEVNKYSSVRHPLGLILVGDFAQLPVVEGERCFHADCWPEFEANTTRLTKIWRQSDREFLDALNHLRRGDGASALDTLTSLTVLESQVDPDFDGMTIFGTNREVNWHNEACLKKVNGEPIVIGTARWGEHSKDWDHIPARLELKIGALVMILANAQSAGGAFDYVNGDLGHIENFDGKVFTVKLLRNGANVAINRIHRTKTSRDEPYGIPEEEWADATGGLPPYGKVSYDSESRLWHVGGIVYYPIRLGYGATCFKVQGLSMDRVQFDFRGHFAGSPSSMYVAISRCRTPQGLRLVGNADQFVRRVCVDPEIVPWL